MTTEPVRGQVVTGMVSRLEDYGAVINLGTIQGLIENVHLSWDDSTPDEILHIGQTVRAVVLRRDETTNELSLSLRAMYPDPLLEFSRNFLGSVTVGEVKRVERVGTFFSLGEGLIGLLPPSSRKFDIGNKVDVKVEMVNLYNRQIYLRLSETP